MKSNIFDKKHYLLIQDLKKSKIHPVLPLALLIAYFIFFIASKLSSIPMLLFTSLIMLIGGLNFTLIYSFQRLIIPFGTLITILILWVKFVERRKLSTLGFDKKDYLHKLLNGFLLGVLFISTTSVIIFIFRGASFSFDLLFNIKSFFGFFFFLFGFLIQGFAEEILTRGWLLPVISKRHNIQIGILCSSIFYASLHIFNTNISTLAILNLFLFSIFASLYTLRNDSLWEICGLHGAWNFSQATIFGFNLSGNKVIGGSLLSMKHSGYDIISGGEYGIEGSLILTFILLISIVLIYNRSIKLYMLKSKKKME